MESILTSIKKELGISEDYTHFDPDLIMYINSVLSILTQIGVGPSDGFRIEDKTSTWKDFISNDVDLELVKSDMVLRVRLLFDPPLSSIVVNSMNEMIKEFEWRLSTIVENKKEVDQNG